LPVIGLSISNYGGILRDKKEHANANKIASLLGRNTEIDISVSVMKQYGFIALCKRYYNLHLNRSGKLSSPYLLSRSKEKLNEGYKIIQIQLDELKLQKKL